GACDSCGGERGECVYSTDLSTAICECFDGWFGDECSRQCPTDADGNVCSTNGTCSSVFNTCSCSDDTFFGSACQLVCVADDNCSGNGTCVFAIENDSELVTCQCYDGFGGDSCETILSTSSLETWQLVLIICGGVAVVVVAIVIVKCCCCSKGKKGTKGEKYYSGVQPSPPVMSSNRSNPRKASRHPAHPMIHQGISPVSQSVYHPPMGHGFSNRNPENSQYFHSLAESELYG
ncbi:hypothetical protein ADUPG1_008724, partial [Aduncisulcus paluster]